jgi:hypothetical protein
MSRRSGQRFADKDMHRIKMPASSPVQLNREGASRVPATLGGHFALAKPTAGKLRRWG